MRANTVAFEIRSSTQQNRAEQANHIYIGIVASHLLAASHLLELLKAYPNMSAVILNDGSNCATLFPRNAPAVVVIDLWDLPLPTLEYLDAFSTAIPGCVFLALDRAQNEVDIARYLRTGFAGFITYDQALCMLGDAINAVAKGLVWTSPEAIGIYRNLTSKRSARREERIAALTTRETEVLDLLRRRYSNREMAILLRISESTVKFHVSNVLMKSNVTGRRDLTKKEFLYRPRLMVS